LTTLSVALLVFLVGVANGSPTGVEQALFILALFLPLVQLGGSVISALVIAGHPQLRREAGAWRRLGWITLGVVVGGVLGFFVMYLPVVLHR
jgi:hypothetical protein